MRVSDVYVLASSRALLSIISCRLSDSHCQQDSKKPTKMAFVHVHIYRSLSIEDHLHHTDSSERDWRQLLAPADRGSCHMAILETKVTLACVCASVRCGVSGGIFRVDGF